jgi:conjugal transfer pilin signal peptidase TrbI
MFSDILKLKIEDEEKKKKFDFYVKAALLSIFLFIILPPMFCALGKTVKVMIDPQVDKCLPDKTAYLVKLKEKTPERGVPFAFKAKGVEPYVLNGHPKIHDLIKFYKDGANLLKIVDGVPGDRVEITADDVLINGQSLGVGGLDLHKTLQKDKSEFVTQYTLGEGEYFMAGRTENSFDSRYWGPIKSDQFIGKAYAIF